MFLFTCTIDGGLSVQTAWSLKFPCCTYVHHQSYDHACMTLIPTSNVLPFLNKEWGARLFRFIEISALACAHYEFEAYACSNGSSLIPPRHAYVVEKGLCHEEVGDSSQEGTCRYVTCMQDASVERRLRRN